jgi:hypothetical protein
MKQLTNTRFFLLLKGNANNLSALKQEYDNFAALLFAEGNAASADRMAYHNMLVYAHMELSEMAEVSGEKSRRLYQESH